MDVKQLNYFVTIVQEGSISSAARKLFMSQPPLSHQMKMLEEELNCKLFERGCKNIVLTEQGKLLYNRAESIIEMMASTKKEVGSLAAYQTIRIGIVSSMIEIACDLLTKYQQFNPAIRYEITEGNTYKLLELLENGAITFAIVRKPYGNNDYQEIPFMSNRIVAVGKQLPEQVDLKYLSNQSLIVYRRWSDILSQQFKSKGLEPQINCLNDDARTSLTLAEKGMGIALVPESSTANTKLEVRRIEDCDISSQVNLVYRKQALQFEYQLNLVDFISKIKKGV